MPLTDAEQMMTVSDLEMWNENRVSMLITGLQNLSTKLHLANGKMIASLCTIILGLPVNKDGGTAQLFHGID